MNMQNTITKLKSQFTRHEKDAADMPIHTSQTSKIKKILKFIFKTPERALLTTVIIGVVTFGAYYAFFNKLTPEEKAQQELAAAVASVSKLMILPQDDQPVLATVTDAKTLISQQAFFAGSVNGDQLLLFPKSMKAVLWSPSRNLIVNVGPIQQSPGTITGNDQNSNAQNEATLTVEVRNGTDKTGLGSQVASQIKADNRYQVLRVTDTTKKDYSQTVVWVSTKEDKKIQLANMLAASVGGKIISELPSGENASDADALVIVGSR